MRLADQVEKDLVEGRRQGVDRANIGSGRAQTIEESGERDIGVIHGEANAADRITGGFFPVNLRNAPGFIEDAQGIAEMPRLPAEDELDEFAAEGFPAELTG